MNIQSHDYITLMEPREKPSAARLIAMAKAAILQASSLGIFERMDRAHMTRDAQWAGKEWNCRKKSRDKKAAFPWDGAPDTEVRLVDGTIAEMTDLRMQALTGAELSVAPRNIGAGEDATMKAGVWKMVADYYLDMFRAEMLEAAELFADTAEEYGHAILRIDWKETRRLEERTMAAETVTALLGEVALERARALVAPEAGVEATLSEDQLALVMAEVENQMRTLLSDPDSRPELVELAMAADPEMPKAEAERVARAMQANEPAVYYAVTVDENRPQWKALLPWVQVWFDPSTTNIREAQWVCETEWLDEVSLRERAATEGWNAEWLERVINTPGGGAHCWGIQTALPTWVLSTLDVGMGVQEEVIEGRSEHRMFQIAIMYYRAANSVGVPCTYRTVFHPGVTEFIAHHEVCAHADAKMPYVSLKNEARQTLVGNRGVAELGIGAQQEMKLQRDARGAQVQLQAQPPIVEPIGNLSGKTPIRPGERIPAMRAGMTPVTFLAVPSIARDSVEMENRTQMAWDLYWGRGKETPMDVLTARRQRMVDRFLEPMREAVRRTFQLIQLYTDDLEASTIAGRPVELAVTRAEIQGQFSLSLNFDVRNLDMEMTGKLLEFIGKLLVPMDTNGVLDRNELIRFALRRISPELAVRVLRDVETAMRSELDDEDEQMAKMVAGIEPPFLMGQAHMARAARLRENMDKNPELQARYREKGVFAALLDNRLKQHDFQVQQQRNAQIGRIGGEPVLGGGAGEGVAA